MLLLYLAIPLMTHASDTTGHNRIFLSFRTQYYMNGKNIISDDREKNMQTKNNWGYCAGIEFERTTRYGLLFNAGMHIGMRKYDISIVKDMSRFDTNATLAPFFLHLDIPNIHYVDMSIMVGYKRQITENYTIVLKAGVFETNLLNGFEEIGDQYIIYNDKYNAYQLSGLLTYAVEMHPGFKKEGTLNTLKYWLNNYPVYEFYIGVERELHLGLAKTIAVGIEANILYPSDGSVAYVTALKDIYSIYQKATHTYYTYGNTSIGIKVAIGFWK